MHRKPNEFKISEDNFVFVHNDKCVFCLQTLSENI